MPIQLKNSRQFTVRAKVRGKKSPEFGVEAISETHLIIVSFGFAVIFSRQWLQSLGHSIGVRSQTFYLYTSQNSFRKKLKEEIDSLPSNLVKDIYQFISSIKMEKKTKGIHSFKLEGQFDKIDIRKEAYE